MKTIENNETLQAQLKQQLIQSDNNSLEHKAAYTDNNSLEHKTAHTTEHVVLASHEVAIQNSSAQEMNVDQQSAISSQIQLERETQMKPSSDYQDRSCQTDGFKEIKSTYCEGQDISMSTKANAQVTIASAVNIPSGEKYCATVSLIGCILETEESHFSPSGDAVDIINKSFDANYDVNDTERPPCMLQ